MVKTHLTRVLRKQQTPWEKKLWSILKNSGLGVKFRRQVKIENYVVDFLCPSKKLIIELDGSQHNEAEIIKADMIRQRKLETRGYTVLRFWNNEGQNNLDGVYLKIKKVYNSYS